MANLLQMNLAHHQQMAHRNSLTILLFFNRKIYSLISAELLRPLHCSILLAELGQLDSATLANSLRLALANASNPKGKEEKGNLENDHLEADNMYEEEGETREEAAGKIEVFWKLF
jgi:hypothetical protein